MRANAAPARTESKELIAEDGAMFLPSSLTISPDGRHIAYTVRASDSGDSGIRVVVDGVPGKVYDEMRSSRDGSPAGEIAFSPDGRRHAFAARKGGSWFIVLDGKESDAWDKVLGPRFSPDGRSMAFIGTRGKKHFLVLDGKAIVSSGVLFYEPIGAYFYEAAWRRREARLSVG
jgi:Tol biopolymer transport system component